MTLIPVIGFAAIALLAILFATFALWRGKSKGWPLLAGAIALFLLGIGGGTYWLTGRPALAVRAAQGLRTHEVNVDQISQSYQNTGKISRSCQSAVGQIVEIVGTSGLVRSSRLSSWRSSSSFRRVNGNSEQVRRKLWRSRHG